MKNSILICFLSIFIFFSCKNDDYFIGGELHNPQVNMTTYDFLKSNKYGMFDTLLMLVDKAGIKEKINQANSTFFAPSDYSISNYLNAKALKLQRVDPNIKWTVDSLIKYDLQQFADSLDIYIVEKQLPNSILTEKGAKLTTKKGNEIVVSYEETVNGNDGATDNSSILPKIVYYTYLFAPLTGELDAPTIPTTIGERTRVQTSNVHTTNGIVHVLSNSTTLFYFR